MCRPYVYDWEAEALLPTKKAWMKRSDMRHMGYFSYTYAILFQSSSVANEKNDPYNPYAPMDESFECCMYK